MVKETGISIKPLTMNCNKSLKLDSIKLSTIKMYKSTTRHKRESNAQL